MASSFNRLVRTAKDLERNREAERLASLEVEDKFDGLLQGDGVVGDGTIR